MARPADVRRPLPWRVGDLLALYGVNAVAAIVLGLAWWGASGTAALSTQVAWTNVGVAGIILAGAGNVVWLMTGRRAVGERRAGLLPDLSHTDERPLAAVPGDHRGQLVAGTAMTRYHRAACPLVVGKPVRVGSLRVHERAGRRPCGVCRPAPASGSAR